MRKTVQKNNLQMQSWRQNKKNRVDVNCLFQKSLLPYSHIDSKKGVSGIKQKK